MMESVPIEEKILRAEELAPRVKAHLQARGMLHLLDELRERATRSKKMMQNSGISETCRICALRGDGSGCCSKKIEQWYEVPTLIINHLMGIELPKIPFDENTCIFLGENGCMLLVRYHFCINYLCQKIEEKIPANLLEAVRANYGKEIFTAWELEKEIWRYFNLNL